MAKYDGIPRYMYKIEFVDYLGNFDCIFVKAESEEKLIKDFKQKK